MSLEELDVRKKELEVSKTQWVTIQQEAKQMFAEAQRKIDVHIGAIAQVDDFIARLTNKTPPETTEAS